MQESPPPSTPTPIFCCRCYRQRREWFEPFSFRRSCYATGVFYSLVTGFSYLNWSGLCNASQRWPASPRAGETPLVPSVKLRLLTWGLSYREVWVLVKRLVGTKVSNMAAICEKAWPSRWSGFAAQRFVTTTFEPETRKGNPLSFIVCPVTLRFKLRTREFFKRRV